MRIIEYTLIGVFTILFLKFITNSMQESNTANISFNISNKYENLTWYSLPFFINQSNQFLFDILTAKSFKNKGKNAELNITLLTATSKKLKILNLENIYYIYYIYIFLIFSLLKFFSTTFLQNYYIIKSYELTLNRISYIFQYSLKANFFGYNLFLEQVINKLHKMVLVYFKFILNLLQKIAICIVIFILNIYFIKDNNIVSTNANQSSLERVVILKNIQEILKFFPAVYLIIYLYYINRTLNKIFTISRNYILTEMAKTYNIVHLFNSFQTFQKNFLNINNYLKDLNSLIPYTINILAFCIKLYLSNITEKDSMITSSALYLFFIYINFNSNINIFSKHPDFLKINEFQYYFLILDLLPVENTKELYAIDTIDYIKIRNLTFKHYHLLFSKNNVKTTYFENLSFQINKGSKICITGQGGGKSTFLKLICNIDNNINDNCIFLGKKKDNKIEEHNILYLNKETIDKLMYFDDSLYFYNMNIIEILKKMKVNYEKEKNISHKFYFNVYNPEKIINYEISITKYHKIILDIIYYVALYDDAFLITIDNSLFTYLTSEEIEDYLTKISATSKSIIINLNEEKISKKIKEKYKIYKIEDNKLNLYETWKLVDN
jgi:energy-coupling factor transporter ATP-binding protein EcfA2